MPANKYDTDQARWLRLLATARKLQVERTGDFTFRVTSSAFRYNHTWYDVNVLHGTCSCPAFTLCTHLAWAEDTQFHETEYDAWFDRYIGDFKHREKALLNGEMPTKMVKTLRLVNEAA